jgi:hypothetical protein
MKPFFSYGCTHLLSEFIKTHNIFLLCFHPSLRLYLLEIWKARQWVKRKQFCKTLESTALHTPTFHLFVNMTLSFSILTENRGIKWNTLSPRLISDHVLVSIPEMAFSHLFKFYNFLLCFFAQTALTFSIYIYIYIYICIYIYFFPIYLL